MVEGLLRGPGLHSWFRVLTGDERFSLGVLGADWGFIGLMKEYTVNHIRDPTRV